MSPAGWIATAILAPLVTGTVAFAWPRRATLVGAIGASVATLAALVLLAEAWASPLPPVDVGGWPPPLGIRLEVDGLGAAFLVVIALVATTTLLAARRPSSPVGREGGLLGERAVVPLWGLLWGGLAALACTRDLFNAYVTLELVTVAAVGLILSDGDRGARRSAVDYLLASTAGATCFLLGVGFWYADTGTLAMSAAAIPPAGIAPAAPALMVAGLLLKMAVVPLHGWLPAAHGSAPAPVSAMLSGLVVKAPMYLLLRLAAGETGILARTPAVLAVTAVLGGAAVLWGSVQAARTPRLKLVVAYSTIAQIGVMALALPLAAASADAFAALAWFALAHAMAKAAMFLAAGDLLRLVGHDRVAELAASRVRPALAYGAFGVAGVALIGLPPSPAFAAKWTLLAEAVALDAWGTVAVLAAGTLGSAVYVFRVLDAAMAASEDVPPRAGTPADRWLALLPITLALGTALAGLASGAILPHLGPTGPP